MIRKTVDDDNLRRHNSIRRFNLRQIEKNRFPLKRGCMVCHVGFLLCGISDYLARQYYLGPDEDGDPRFVCRGCDLESKVRIAAGTLYHLINALPRAERDQQEIYPADFSTALIPLPLRSNWGWRTLDRWHEQGIAFGMSARAATGQDSLGLRDYSQPTRLLNKFGTEFAYRQKAASPVRVIEGGDYNIRRTLEEQLALQRIGRLYKSACWSPKKDRRQKWITQQDELCVDAQLDAPRENAGAAEWRRIARQSGQVGASGRIGQAPCASRRNPSGLQRGMGFVHEHQQTQYTVSYPVAPVPEHSSRNH
jgi:hypothetical protein